MKTSCNQSEFQLAMEAPLCPKLLRSDAIVTQENGWHRTLTPSSPWAADDNEILFSNLSGDTQEVDACIDSLIDEYHGLGRPIRWCVYPWTYPDDLGQRLIERGAERSDVRALLAPTSLPLEQIEGADIVKVEPNSEDYAAYIELMASGEMSSGKQLPKDEIDFRSSRYHELISGPKPVMQLFLARVEGKAAGCAAVYIKDNSAWMTGDYVAPGFQGRGLFQSLISARLKALREMNIKFATGHGRLETSVPWLIRFGFQSIFPYEIYQINPPLSNQD